MFEWLPSSLVPSAINLPWRKFAPFAARPADAEIGSAPLLALRPHEVRDRSACQLWHRDQRTAKLATLIRADGANSTFRRLRMAISALRQVADVGCNSRSLA